MFPFTKPVGLFSQCFLNLPVLGFLQSKQAPRSLSHLYSRTSWGPSNPVSCSRTQLQLDQHRLYSLALEVQDGLDVQAGGFVQPQRLLAHRSTI